MSHFLFVFFLSLILLNQRQLKCIRYVASGCVDLIPIEKKKKENENEERSWDQGSNSVGLRIIHGFDLFF